VIEFIEGEAKELNVALVPTGVPPTDWTEGITVRKIVVNPSTAYVGETVEIKIYIDYPVPLPPLPMDIQGAIFIDGVKLTNQWHIEEIYDTTLLFEYIPTEVGNYTVKAQDKSADFTVLEDIVATYYMPWGGERMPVSIDIIVPDVEPFDVWGVSHPGGDFRYSAFPYNLVYYPYPACRAIYWVPPQFDKIIARLPSAYPSEWDPADSNIISWVGHLSTGYNGATLTIMPLEYDCKPYWESKEELAELIDRVVFGHGIGRAVFEEWKTQYGITCSGCIVAGIKNIEKEIKYYSICGAGKCTPHIHCPYCGENISGPSHTRGRSWDTLSFIRTVLRHIETSHPNHPLTEPAWF
jgi:hypothetical protein